MPVSKEVEQNTSEMRARRPRSKAPRNRQNDPSSPFSPSLPIRSAQRTLASEVSFLDPYVGRPAQSVERQGRAAYEPRNLELDLVACDRELLYRERLARRPRRYHWLKGTAISSPTEQKILVDSTGASWYRDAHPFPARLEMKTDIPLEEGLGEPAP